ncbi:uncharacterized protein LOC143178231 [Calliopsis andreniformis]|uniref:uncharacterized protein LOC143178231 n=1 Tax=Calliopsis andreniformis TaxID=337506 RepID=UPI003FCDF7E0
MYNQDINSNFLKTWVFFLPDELANNTLGIGLASGRVEQPPRRLRGGLSSRRAVVDDGPSGTAPSLTTCSRLQPRSRRDETPSARFRISFFKSLSSEITSNVLKETVEESVKRESSQGQGPRVGPRWADLFRGIEKFESSAPLGTVIQEKFSRKGDTGRVDLVFRIGPGLFVYATVWCQ